MPLISEIKNGDSYYTEIQLLTGSRLLTPVIDTQIMKRFQICQFLA